MKAYGINPEARGRCIARVLFAYRGRPRGQDKNEVERANPHKFNFLVTAVTQVMTNALPENGQRVNSTVAVSQRELADCAGLDRRETATRRISQVAETLPSKCRKRTAEPHVLITRKRGQPGNPNTYAYAGLPESCSIFRILDRNNNQENGSYFSAAAAQRRAQELEREKKSVDRFVVVERPRLDVENWHAPRLEQLLADPERRHLWDESFARSWAQGSFKKVPHWIWSPRLRDPELKCRACAGSGHGCQRCHGLGYAPLGDIPRLVLTVYVLMGLMDFGEVSPKQHDVARLCGTSPKAVYLANQKLSRLAGGAVIRVVPRGGRRRADGSMEPARPTLVLYLPLRTISREEAAAERQRFAARCQATGAHPTDNRAYKAFSALLAQWEGTEKRWGTFWRQLHRDLLAAGIGEQTIARLIPNQPPG